MTTTPATLNLPCWDKPVTVLGNADALKHSMIGFLCSRTYPAKSVLRVYDWAKQVRDEGRCVVSGFHSLLEQDVLEILLDGDQPIVLVVARGMPKRLPPIYKRKIKKNLLLVSPFATAVTRINAKTARNRNKLVIAMSKTLVVGSAPLESSLKELIPTNIPLTRLDK